MLTLVDSHALPARATIDLLWGMDDLAGRRELLGRLARGKLSLTGIPIERLPLLVRDGCDEKLAVELELAFLEPALTKGRGPAAEVAHEIRVCAGWKAAHQPAFRAFLSSP